MTSMSTIEALNKFFSRYPLLTYKKDDIIIRADDEPPGVYFVRSGYVRMGSILADGGELTFNIFKPGAFFPMTWAISEAKNSYLYQAISELRVCRAPKLEVIKFVKENPEVLYDLTRRILVGLDSLLTNIQYLLFGNSYNRIAAAILLLAKRFGQKTPNGQMTISLDLIHQDIANLVGVTRETASIALKRLEKRGVIARNRKKFIVNNVQVLEKEIAVMENEIEAPLAI